MPEKIILMLHALKLLLLTQGKYRHYWVPSLFLFMYSNYFLVKDLFHLYYTLTLGDARKHLLRSKETKHLLLNLCINLFLIGVYFYAFPQELILLLFTFLVIFIHRCFYKQSLFESDNLNFCNELSLGYGASLCYYENYLKYIIREPKLNVVTRIRMFKFKEGIENMSHKLFILVPSSCKIETYIDDSKHIHRSKELEPLEINISGIPKRKFNITAYHITDDDPRKSFRLALEYAQPLKVLFSLKEKGLITVEEMHRQRKIFTNSLKEMLTRSKNSDEIHLIEYDDEVSSYELFDVLMNVESVYEYKQYKN